VTVAESASLDLSSGMTLEARVRASSLGARWRTVLAKELPGQVAFALHAHEGGAGAGGDVFRLFRHSCG